MGVPTPAQTTPSASRRIVISSGFWTHEAGMRIERLLDVTFLTTPFTFSRSNKYRRGPTHFCMLLQEDVDEHGGIHYGELIPLDKMSNPWAPWRTDRVYHSFEDIAVLRSRFWTYRFLANCCVIILACDNDQHTSDSTSPRERTHPTLLQATMEASYKSYSKTLPGKESSYWSLPNVMLLWTTSDACETSLPTTTGLSESTLAISERSLTISLGTLIHTEWKRDPPAMGKTLAQVCIPTIEEVSM